jgi:serine/threonine protein kinase
MGANFDATPRIAMEYVALGALRDHIGITRTEALIILRQCTSALSFLHGHEPAIIHRDIKPHNILVQQRGEGGANGHIVVKLCDFGLAREIPREQIDSHPGTLRYTPPEYYPVDGYQPSLGVKIDIWCLGLVTFELVSRTLLSCSSTRYQSSDGDIIVGTPIHDKIVKDLHRFAENYHQGDFAILKRMLVLDPVGRITAKEAHELAEGMDISAFEPVQTVIATATATEPGTVVGQPLVDQAESAAEDMGSLSISRPRLAKRKRGNY